MGKLIEILRKYKYLIALISVFNFLLTPIHTSLSGMYPAQVVVINYTLVILASSLIASNTSTRLRSYVLGVLVLIFIWLEFSDPNSDVIRCLRLLSSFILFLYFCILLIQQLKKIKSINLQFIMGPILGFIYLGIIGGILFETMHFIEPNSFHHRGDYSGYIFYYFSFISITTVGYGDITPLTPQAQSITLVMNIIGQFYLAIVIGVFVGKYINVKS
ncbi:potassium channel family protein [Aquimarina sp. 2201CG5-10]|uniref:potassium channel family protein n=1 Tax=Aquimarina callyspongiae TaxID=3098150 RepID=UPI002AB56430|nr:potassium channel family protein [Aquimarina sp. 2201CG5-10]MDY8134554.1 potassium channel family protein [Aquimarina sp. 2201CG5-10]